MARKRPPEQEEAEINMTPMLDVTFILLIFFLVTTSFVKPTGADVTEPTAITTKALQQGNILIGVTANNQVWMNKQKINLEDVRTRVEQAKSETPQGTVVVVADKDASTSEVVKVMDQARLGGAEKVWIATTKEGSE